MQNCSHPSAIMAPTVIFTAKPYCGSSDASDFWPAGNQSDGSNDGPDNGQGDDGDNNGTGLVTKTRIQTKKPSLYRVVILNDDYTPMEFVVFILERLFNKNAEQAYKIMLHVHNHGVGVCGIFTYEVAETKVAQVRDLARRNEHPLRCDLERED